jgi:hypothetical protein
MRIEAPGLGDGRSCRAHRLPIEAAGLAEAAIACAARPTDSGVPSDSGRHFGRRDQERLGRGRGRRNKKSTGAVTRKLQDHKDLAELFLCSYVLGTRVYKDKRQKRAVLAEFGLLSLACVFSQEQQER